MRTDVVVVLCCVGAVVFAASAVAVWLWVSRYVNNTTKTKLSKTCPTLEYTGRDIDNPKVENLTCTDMLRAFGPELASFVDSTEPMTCTKFQEILEMDEVKSILLTDSIPADFCSKECCDASVNTPIKLACIGSKTSDDEESSFCNNMCVNGITEAGGWRCDLGRKFTYLGDGKVQDSWTSGVYNAQMYGDVSLEEAETICCTEQKKEGLE